MTQNIWEVVTFEDLLYFLRKSEKKFVILGLVLNQTPKNIKFTIKKFMKNKADDYQHITFLYYKVRPEDFGRLSILGKDVNVYPKMCHIYNIKELLMEVSAIDCYDVLEDAFADMAEYYAQDPIPQNEQQKPQEQQEQKQQFIQQRKIDPITERKKLTEKIALLNKKSQEYTIEFFKDCKQRKKEEEEMKDEQEKEEKTKKSKAKHKN